jgi:transcriptional antiterminator NusG
MSRWYIIHAYSGFENKVRDRSWPTRPAWASIAGRSRRSPDRDRHRGPPRQEGPVRAEILPRLCPRQADDERRRLSPGEEHAEGDGLPRRSGKPQPISEAEAARILNTKEEAAAQGAEAPIKRRLRRIGDQVKVLDRPFASFNGHGRGTGFRKEPRPLRSRCRSFGRATPGRARFRGSGRTPIDIAK